MKIEIFKKIAHFNFYVTIGTSGNIAVKLVALKYDTNVQFITKIYSLIIYCVHQVAMKNLIFLSLCLVGYKIHDTFASKSIHCFDGNRCLFDEECGYSSSSMKGKCIHPVPKPVGYVNLVNFSHFLDKIS